MDHNVTDSAVIAHRIGVASCLGLLVALLGMVISL